MTTTPSRSDLKREAAWLLKHPQFSERPASFDEFLGPDYLNVEKKIRTRIKQELRVIFGDKVRTDKPTAYPYAMITGGIGIGKQSRWSEPVLTPKGWVPISSLAPGDLVIGSNGKPTRVTGVYPQGVKPIWRVTFTDGSWTDTGPEHNWAVRTRHQEYAGREFAVKTTAEILAAGLRQGDSWKWRIPIVEPVEYEAAGPLPVDPYTLGALLGDGCFTRRTVTLAGDDLAMADRIAPTLPAGVRMVRGDRDWRFSGQYGQPNAFVTLIESLGYVVGFGGHNSHTKFIPEMYLRAAPADRLELLRGLMDTDGSVFGNNRSVFCNSNKLLCEQVIELVQSLGGTARLTSFGRNGTTEYQVKVNLGAVCPFWLPRKVAKWKPRTNQKPTRAITSIEYVGDDEAVCISVDAPDHLFVTRDFIVTHNTTIASIVLPYLVHWCLCLKDPQGFFDLLPGSRIAFMQMSTSEKQALEVVFGDIKARIEHSPWFKNHPYNPKFTTQIRFEKDIWIIPGDSAETTFEGYNILGGILDEADSHKVTPNKDYAEQGFDTIDSRIASRFQKRGFLLVIGQMKKSTGFAAKKYAEFKARDDAHAVSLPIWESMGEQFYRDQDPDGLYKVFGYDRMRKQIIPGEAASLIADTNSHIILVPEMYRPQFSTNPEKALRDLAGIPPVVGDPFISLVHKIHEARDLWLETHKGFASPALPNGVLEPWFQATDSLPRVAHLDIAYSGEGDALGFAMGHVNRMVEIDGELKPHIVIDLLWRIRALPGQEIFLSDVRRFIYSLRNDLRFKLRSVSMDGFQSTDTMQQLQRRRFDVEYISIDKQVLPYHDLREAIYEGRIEFPPLLVNYKIGDNELVEIAVKELTELVDAGKKIDHPEGGSKDIADAMAGVVFKLMGDRSYHGRRTVSSGSVPSKTSSNPFSPWSHPAYLGDSGMKAPVPPSNWSR